MDDWSTNLNLRDNRGWHWNIDGDMLNADFGLDLGDLWGDGVDLSAGSEDGLLRDGFDRSGEGSQVRFEYGSRVSSYDRLAGVVDVLLESVASGLNGGGSGQASCWGYSDGWSSSVGWNGSGVGWSGGVSWSGSPGGGVGWSGGKTEGWSSGSEVDSRCRGDGRHRWSGCQDARGCVGMTNASQAAPCKGNAQQHHQLVHVE